MVTPDTPSPAPAAAPLRLRKEPSRRGLWTGALLGVAASATAWIPALREAAGIFWNDEVSVLAPEWTCGLAAAGGLMAAWVGWAVDSWGKRLFLLTAALGLSGTQSFLMARNFATGWEPFSMAAALSAGLLTAAVLTPRGAGVERWFQGRLGRLPLQRLTMALDTDFLLPDQREAAVLTCRMLNETALREQMPAREFLRLMEAFRATASSVLMDYGALLDAPESGSVRAFFGLPLAMENHADRAASAALALSEAMRQFALDHMHRDRDPVECGTGIACGTLTAGISADTYNAAGDAVEQSRWLASLNAEYQTSILTDSTTHRVADNTEDRPLEILNPPEGAALEIFHLLGVRGGLSGEALARRDAFRDAIMLLRAGHAEDALARFTDAREGLVHGDAALERFVSQAEEQCARDDRKPPPPARPRARLSPRRVHRQ